MDKLTSFICLFSFRFLNKDFIIIVVFQALLFSNEFSFQFIFQLLII